MDALGKMRNGAEKEFRILGPHSVFPHQNLCPPSLSIRPESLHIRTRNVMGIFEA